MKLYPCDKSETVFHLVFLCCNDQESFQNGLLSRSLSKKKVLYIEPQNIYVGFVTTVQKKQSEGLCPSIHYP